MLWWLLGIGGVYGVYKILATRQRMIEVSEHMLAEKIRYHRDQARRGDKKSVQYLKSLDAVLERLNRDDSNSSLQIITSLQLQGLYPPSAI